MFCGRCNGNGKIDKYKNHLLYFGKTVKPKFTDCPNCDGTGQLVCISKKKYEHFKRLIEMEREE